MAAFDDVVIISGCRTAVGKFQGSLSDLSAPQLGAVVVREAVKRARLNSDQVDECIMGNVLPAGLGQNPARQAAIFAATNRAAVQSLLRGQLLGVVFRGRDTTREKHKTCSESLPWD